MLWLPTGRIVVNEVLHRCSRIGGIDSIVLAIPDTSDCDILVEASKLRPDYRIPYRVVHGPEQDVLARYAMAAERVDADVIMRITSDCPCIDPGVCEAVLQKFLSERQNGVEYCSNVWPRSYPTGYDCEVFSRAALDRAHKEATDAADREHVTPYMVRNETKANVCQDIDESNVRITLDTVDDYIEICKHLSDTTRWVS